MKQTWTWEEGTPAERAIWVRAHFGAPFDVAAVCDLFDLSQTGLLRIMGGDVWRPEYARSYWRVTHPGVDYILEYDGELVGELAKRLIEYAERYRVEPVDLLADLIERVLQDDLVDAVMDKIDGATAKKEKIRLGRDTPSFLEDRFSKSNDEATP